LDRRWGGKKKRGKGARIKGGVKGLSYKPLGTHHGKIGGKKMDNGQKGTPTKMRRGKK